MASPLGSASTLAPLLAAAAWGVVGCATTDPPRQLPSPLSADGRPAHRPRPTSAAAYTHFIRSQLYRDEGLTRQAIQELRGALTFDPRSPYLLVALGDLRFEQGRLNEALDRVREALTLDRSFAPAYLLRGRIHRVGRNYPLAVEAFSEAIQAASDDPDGYLSLGELHQEYGRTTEAARIYERMVARIPESAEAHFVLGGLALDRQAYEEAERHYRLALEANPLLTAARLRLAAVLERLERHGEAIAEYTTAHDESGADEEVVYNLIRLHLRRGQAHQADHYIEGLREAYGGDTETLTRIGETCFDARDYVRASAAFEESLRMDPNHHAVRVWLGASRYANGAPEDALRVLGQVPPTSEWFDDARRLVARILGDRGRLHDAARIYEALLPSRRRDPGLYEALSEIRVRQGDFDGALAILGAGLREMPGDPHLRLQLARVRAQNGDWADARGDMERLLKVNPDHFGALLFLARSLADRGERLEEAQRHAEKAQGLRPNSGEVADVLGWIHLKRGRWDKAMAHLQEARRLAPESPEVLEHLAQAYEARSQHAEASEARRRAATLRQGPSPKGLPQLPSPP